MLLICYNNLVWSVNGFTLTCLHLLSAPAPSEERPEPVTCICESVCQCTESVWGWVQRGLILTSSVIMVGHSEVRCWGDIRRSSTLKNRNTWAWRMGTWGRRRLSTRRSKHKRRALAQRTIILLGKWVSDEHVCVCRQLTLYVWQVFLVLVYFATVDGESQTFEQHGSLL